MTTTLLELARSIADQHNISMIDAIEIVNAVLIISNTTPTV